MYVHMYVSVQQQQLMERFRQSQSDLEAIKKELSDQADSYIGIIDEKEKTIMKVY